ncbi:MAG: O-antigen ligase family protein, partial [Elusimicrobiota bacterium]
LEAGLWLVAGAMPLAWSTSLFAEYTLPKLLLLSAGVLVSSAGLFWGAASGAIRVRSTEMDLPLLASAAALALATVFSRDRLLSLSGSYNEHSFGVWPMLLCVAVYYLAAWGLEGERQRRVRMLSIVVGAAVSCYAVLQGLGFEPWELSGNIPQGRAVSAFGSPVYLGAYLALVLPLALDSALVKSRERWYGTVSLALIAAGLWATISKGAWLAAGTGALAYLALTGRLRPRRWGRWVRTAAILGVAAAALILALRLSLRGTDWTQTSRREIWRSAWAAFLDRPATGWGPDTFELVFRRHKSEAYVRSANLASFQVHAHNDFLQALATTGLAGTAAYAFFIAALAMAAWRRLREPTGGTLAAALASALIALLLNMQFNPPPLAALAMAAMFMGMLCVPIGPLKVGAKPGTPRALLPAGLLLLAGIVSVGLSWRMVRADGELRAALELQRLGLNDQALERLLSAVRLNGWELEYRKRIVRHLTQRAHDGLSRLERFDLAARHAAEARNLHPKHAQAHYLCGFTALKQAQAGRPERLHAAEMALDSALDLDPLGGPVLRARYRAALLRGDPGAAAWRERLERLERR